MTSHEQSVSTVYTVGYTGWTLAGIVETARELGAVVVDVRLVPRSRVPWANPGPLRSALGDAQYAWVRDLGNVNYKGGPIKIAALEKGLDRVARILADGHPVILLCMCRDHAVCHRTVVADAAAARTGARIVHLEPQPAKPARVDEQSKPRQLELL